MLLNCTGSFPDCWFLVLKNIVLILNCILCLLLDYHVSLTVLTGIAQDINIFCILCFTKRFIFVKKNNTSFLNPINILNVLLVFRNIEHTITFIIFIINTLKIIYRSKVRSTIDPLSQNLCPNNWRTDCFNSEIIYTRSEKQ